MERFSRFTILEPLTQGRIRSYRVWDPASKQVTILHLGWGTETEIPTLAPESIRERGKADEQVYLLTPDSPGLYDLNASASPDPVPVRDAGKSGGEFTRMFQQWKEEGPPVAPPKQPASAPAASAKPAAQAADPDATRLMPTPTWTPEMAQARKTEPALGAPEKPIPQIVKQVIRIGPSRAKASDQISNPALSLLDAVPGRFPASAKPPIAQPGDFTQAFQNTDAVLPIAPKGPPRAAEQPGEFTRMFAEPLPATPPRQVASAPSPAPSVTPEPKEIGEFTRMFQQPSGSVAPQNPVSPRAVEKNDKDFEKFFQSGLPDSGREIDFDVLTKNPPKPSAPPPKPSGEFTQMFGRPLSVDAPLAQSIQPPPQRNPAKSAPGNANATVLFEAPVSPAPKSDPAKPGDYTQEFARPLASGGAAKTPSEPVGTPAKSAFSPKPPSKAPIGALILIGAALIVIVILLVLFLVLRR